MWGAEGGWGFEFERIVCCCRLRVCGCLSSGYSGLRTILCF